MAFTYTYMDGEVDMNKHEDAWREDECQCRPDTGG
jgi:hypothetical protein